MPRMQTATHSKKTVYIGLDFDGVLHPIHGCADRKWTDALAAGEWTPEDFLNRVADELLQEAAGQARDDETAPRPFKYELEPRFPFDRSAVLENVLQRHPDVRLVVATAWRRGLTVDQLRAIMPPRLAARVVGKLDEAHESDQGKPIPGIRAQLMERWVQSNAPGAPWLAIDDTEELWHGSPAPLVKPHFWHGLQARDAHVLHGHLQRLEQAAAVQIRPAMPHAQRLHAFEPGRHAAEPNDQAAPQTLPLSGMERALKFIEQMRVLHARVQGLPRGQV